ncbi:MAG: nuclease, partial [Gemmatimonadetes bacterium]|nr:nuclease [Gemmatimonadota bacterium]NIU37295.1 nuclease [Gemmatimonadota bacterium]NIV63259.1 nuclease [Gemmatimonadota bacterium]NIV84231.1 nuclease [Gemmatimonadota bacterium]NIW65975.1 nuclease [Gemmatimonadota bacterium]
ELLHALGLRDCPATTPIHFGDQLEIFRGERPPRCMRADTGSCLAPCAGRCTEEEYTARIRTAHRFLEGRTREPIVRLERAMGAAARRRDFEYAALLRDRARRLARFQERLVAFRGTVASLSFVYRVPGYRGDDRLYLVRRGRVVEDVPHPKDRRSREEAVRQVSGVFPGPAEDPADLGPEEAAEILLVARWFRRRPKELERTWEPREWLRRKRPA